MSSTIAPFIDICDRLEILKDKIICCEDDKVFTFAQNRVQRMKYERDVCCVVDQSDVQKYIKHANNILNAEAFAREVPITFVATPICCLMHPWSCYYHRFSDFYWRYSETGHYERRFYSKTAINYGNNTEKIGDVRFFYIEKASDEIAEPNKLLLLILCGCVLPLIVLFVEIMKNKNR